MILTQENVPLAVRDAYLKLKASEAGKREEPLHALREATVENPGPASSLALAKGYIYMAIDASAAAGKVRDPAQQDVRDEAVGGFLAKALRAAVDGTTFCQSYLCTVRHESCKLRPCILFSTSF